MAFIRSLRSKLDRHCRCFHMVLIEHPDQTWIEIIQMITERSDRILNEEILRDLSLTIK